MREHNNKIQIYRYGEIDGVEHYYYATNDDAEINVGVYYDIKVLYNTLNGKIEVYKDNVLATSWQCDDALFWQSGKHLALRAAECDVSFDDIKIYRKRFNNEIISIDSENGLIPVESENETSPAGKYPPFSKIISEHGLNFFQRIFLLIKRLQLQPMITTIKL